MDITREKKKLRQERFLINQSISPQTVQDASKRIAELVTALPAFMEARSIFCYVSVGDEINTQMILEAALQRGKILSVPKCLGHGLMEARIIHRTEELERGFFGLMEPPFESEMLDSPELCIMPCVAYTENAIRLGHGGGYYDRYLAAHPGMKTVMLAGSWQFCVCIPYDDNDRKADCVITERTMIGR